MPAAPRQDVLFGRDAARGLVEPSRALETMPVRRHRDQLCHPSTSI